MAATQSDGGFSRTATQRPFRFRVEDCNKRILATLSDPNASHLQRAAALHKGAQQYTELFKQPASRIRAQRVIAVQKPDMRSACSQLQSRNVPPLLRTRVVRLDGSTTISTDPAVVDQVAIDAWANVHRGNVGPAAAPLLAASFLGTVGEHFPFSDPHCLCPITAEQVASGIGNMPANTPGLDGVRKDDLSILSPYACQCLADMMNAIESGCPWPKQCTVGRLAFLSGGGPT